MIYGDLASMIAHGYLGPGTRIPTDADLSAEYRCGIGTVQQAVSRLRSQGIVHTVTTLGRFVTDEAPRICREEGY